MRLFGMIEAIGTRFYVSPKCKSRDLVEIVGDMRIRISVYLERPGIEITVVPGVRRAGASQVCEPDATST